MEKEGRSFKDFSLILYLVMFEVVGCIFFNFYLCELVREYIYLEYIVNDVF